MKPPYYDTLSTWPALVIIALSFFAGWGVGYLLANFLHSKGII